MTLTPDEAVRHVQTRLKAAGFFGGWVGGTFGAYTLGAFLAAVPLPPGVAALRLPAADGEAVRWVQGVLKAPGLYAGPIDGDFGPRTQAGFDRAVPPPQGAPAPAPPRPPWVEAMLEVLGLHEGRDNARLRAWLKRDGRTLGDPASLPWCGDAVQTGMRIALPAEPLPGALGEDPYWALNWRLLGRKLLAPGYGCIAVKPRNGGGHVTTVVGVSGSMLACLGGNQDNTMSVALYPRGAFTDFRWPVTYAPEPHELPRVSAADLPTQPSEV